MKDFNEKIDIEKGNKAIKIQKLIDKLFSKLDELGYEYMNHNNRSAIRRKRNG
tara:strand:- start:157 stop:315 length:159 start_codon:yes stop_codon:yes gene_type:complete